MNLPRTTILPLLALIGLLPMAGCGGDSATTAPNPAASSAAPDEVELPSANPTDGSSVATTPEAAAVQGASATPRGEASASTGASTSTTPTPSGGASLPAGAKKFATANLPTKVGGYAGEVAKPGDGTQNGMYTGTTEDQMVMVTLSPSLQFSRVTAKLTSKSSQGLATCGTADAVTSCFAPLDGGVLWLQGTDRSKPAELAALTNQVYDSFA